MSSDTRFDGLVEWEEPDGDELVEEDVEPVESPPWRRRLLIVVAVLTAVSLAIVPIYNVLQGRTIADNGLEVCAFDYCVVQDAVSEAGMGTTMSRLSNWFTDEEEARLLAAELTEHLGVAEVELEIVDALDGSTGGVYHPGARLIEIEMPARAWTVLHEVAHVVESGHGEDFRSVVVELARSVQGLSS